MSGAEEEVGQDVLALTASMDSRRAEKEELGRLRREVEDKRREIDILRRNASLDEETLAELRGKLERRSKLYRVTAEELERLKQEAEGAQTLKTTQGKLKAELEASRRGEFELKHRVEDETREKEKAERDRREAETRLSLAEEEAKSLKLLADEERRALEWELAREREVKNQLSQRLQGLESDSAVKKAELHSLRERLNTETPLRKNLKRQSSREDLLVAEVSRLRSQIENLGGKDPENLVSTLSEELGSLKAHRERDAEKIAALEEDKSRLNTATELLRAQLKDAEEETERLRHVLNEKESESSQTHAYLVDELTKTKRQKAELRCRFLELERKQGRLVAGELGAVGAEGERRVSGLEKSLVAAGEVETELRQALAEANAAKAEALEAKAAERSRVVELEASILTLRETVEELDRQCSDLEQRRRKDSAAFARRLEEAKTAKEEEDSQSTATATAIAALTRERDREAAKAGELQAELTATHKDYRDQLALLTARLSQASKQASSEPDPKLAMTQASLRDANKEVTGLQRRLAETQAALTARLREDEEKAAEFARLKEERDKALTNLRFAVEKAEELKAEKEATVREKESLADMLTSLSNPSPKKSPANPDPFGRRAQNELELKLQDVRNRYGLSAYQASSARINPPASPPQLRDRVAAPPPPPPPPPPPLPRPSGSLPRQPDPSPYISPPRANEWVRRRQVSPERQPSERTETPISTDSSSHLTYDSDVLNHPHHSSAPYMRAEDSVPVSTRSEDCSETCSCVVDEEEEEEEEESVQLIHTNTNTSSAVSAGERGTMRHNIPHRWKRFLVLYPLKCLVCMDGLSLFRHGHKCADCSIIVHSNCAMSLLNTCGLPMHLTEYYMDSLHSGPATPATPTTRRRQSIMETPSEEGRMTGWVKLWRSYEPEGAWKDVWGCMDINQLVFHKDDSCVSPIETINLERQQWRIHFERGVEREDASAVESRDLPFLVEIKVVPPEEAGRDPYRLYFMCPTLPAKQRWVNALQVATTRKLFARRVPSLKLRQNLFLQLPSLDVRATVSLESKFLLIGSEQGLFYTQLRSPSSPLAIHGVKGKILAMEFLPSIEMLVLIAGEEDRQLWFVHSGELLRSLAAGLEKGSAPVAKAVAPFPQLSFIHLMRSVEAGGHLFLVVADPSSLHILKYSSRIGSFKQERSLNTAEPTACLERLGETILVGTERVFLLHPRSGLLQDFFHPEDRRLAYVIETAPVRKEFPTAATIIRQPSGTEEGEVLISYRNFGVFASSSGRSTRQSVEWMRSPLELAFTSPFLFIFHFESVQVLRLGEWGSQALEAVAMLELRSPQLVGRGLADGDLFLTTGKSQLLLLNAFAKAESGGFLKRKALQPHNITRKRSKD